MHDKTESMDEFTEVDETASMDKFMEAGERTSLVPQMYPSSARSSTDNVEPIYMPHTFLQEITDDFSDMRLLGSGTFGVVYKGECSDAKEIAVKKLKFMGVEVDDFDREFKHLAKLRHPNIVKLLGFCNETEEVIVEHNGKPFVANKLHRALCFEYMHKGSLEKYLSDEDHGFAWHKRYRIIKGICEGLKYLHMGESPVFHLDLKPENILLNKNMVPKIADFGLSRLLGEQNTRNTISAVGTSGYLPPEYINLQIISKEFDIFSLGVIILKIIVGPTASSRIGEMERTKFTEHVCNKWRERLQLIPGYNLRVSDDQQVKKCIEIALKCIETDKRRRPGIGDIIVQLKETETSSLPSWIEEFDDREVPPKSNIPESKPGLPRTPIKELPFKFLEDITNGFSDELKVCHTASGPVYKGILQNGEVITVKRLEGNIAVRAGKQFLKEATNLVAQHKNILKLLGVCSVVQNKLMEYRGKHIIADIDQCMLCYEYAPNGSLRDYLLKSYDVNTDWDRSFNMIKGICQGVHFMHQEMGTPTAHMDLHPENILLDGDMVPKIADFGYSGLPRNKTTLISDFISAPGYMAPEYLYRGEISPQCDIYSLGVLILEIIRRRKRYLRSQSDIRNFITYISECDIEELVLSEYYWLDDDHLDQVIACIEIGIKCVDVTPMNRPSTMEIIERINAVAKDGNGLCTELLDVHPAQLRLPFKPEKLISCSLELTNTKHDPIAVRLLTDSVRRFMAKMPLCCVVPPKSTYTLIVTRSQQKNQPLSSSSNEFVTLESSIVADGDSPCLKTASLDSATVKFSQFFKEARESAADKVYELKLNVVSDPTEETSSGQPQLSEIEIISDRKISQVLSVDVHVTKPWILTANQGGEVVIWDYQAQATVTSFDFTKKPVYSAKFIEREQWLVAGDAFGTIYVYSYDTGEEVTIIDAHEGDVTALDVHPTDPVVLSSSGDHLIKLWDWKKDWTLTGTFEGHLDRVTHVNFNPMDANSFTSASLDNTIKIWNISSSESKDTLSDYPDSLLCVHNYTSDMQQYLIAGSLDGTAQIWDMETRRCIQTLKGHVSRISCVYRHPDLPAVITGSHDGTIRLWNSTTYRLENIVGINLGTVHALGYIKDLRRTVVGCQQGIAVMEIKLP